MYLFVSLPRAQHFRYGSKHAGSKDGEGNPATVVVEKTFAQRLSSFMEEMLTEAAEARRYGTTLKMFELSDKYVAKLTDHASFLEGVSHMYMQSGHITTML